MPIETVFLDAGGVLVHPNWERVSGILAQHGVSIPASALRAAEPSVKRAYDTPALATNGFDLFRSVIKAAGLPKDADISNALREIEAFDRQYNAWDYVEDDLKAALIALRDKGLKLVVVSNSNGTLKNMLRRLELYDHFDLVFDSHEEGVAKPNPAFFHLALRASGSAPESTLHVGDFYHIDVIGARDAGIRPILLDVGDLYSGVDCERINRLCSLPAYLR